MDRPVIYTQEQGRSVDFLFGQRAAMIAIAKLTQAAFGGNTFVRGLAVTPNSPAALNVLVGIGEIYTLAVVDATTYGSLPADTTDQIVQQGLNMAAQTISTPAPSTSGYSIAYLIEAQFQSQDTTPLVPPFYNSSNPQIPLNGQGGSGAPLPTERQGVCVIQAKAGIAATTGTQVTPTVDSGWTALAVVTVANGQSTVVAGNITIPAGVPQITSLLQMMQQGSAVYAQDTSGAANTITLALTPAITSYGDGEPIRFKAANTNTGPCVINWGGGSISLNGAKAALQGGEIVAGGQYEAMYNSTSGTATLTGQAAGALQIAPATQPLHAVQFGQVPGLSGKGECYFSYVSATSVQLLPYNGSNLLINNVPQQVPQAGITASNSGLAASTLYYVYATWSGSAIVLSFSTTGHTLGTNGIQVQTGNAAATLVGMVYTNASSQFVSTTSQRQVASWFNRKAVTAFLTGSSSPSFTNTSLAAVYAAINVTFVCWGEDSVSFASAGSVQCSNASALLNMGAALDGVTSLNQSMTSPLANAFIPYSLPINESVSEGFHTISLFGSISTGNAVVAPGTNSVYLRQ